DETPIGEIVQENVFGKIRFGFVVNGRSVGGIFAENWRAWNFSIQDHTGTEVARVTKTWGGFIKAAFTTADNYVVEIPHPLPEPGVYEVSTGVYRIPLPLPNDALRAVNVYAVTDGEKLVLVDSGWALTLARQQLSDALGGIGAELADVSEFLVTHVHRDHYSQ